MVIFSSRYTQHYYTKFVALPSVLQQSKHKTTQNVIYNTGQRSRVHVYIWEYMITYRLWRIFIEVLYVTVIKLHDNIEWSWIRRSKLYLSNDALKMVYYAFFHSVMSYGLIFWGNSTKSKCVFKLQKRAIRIIMGARNNDSFTEILKS